TEIEADGYPAGIWFDNSGHIAAGDIDSDGSVDLVITGNRALGTIALERDGSVKWYQPNYPTNADNWGGLAPAIADLDADGSPEVIMGRTVLAGADGSHLWTGTAGLGTNGFLGPVNAIGDVDRDGHLNVLAGATMYDDDGTELWTYAAALTTGSCATATCDGFTATGNFDGDDFGEVVIVRGGYIHVVNHDGYVMNHNGYDVVIAIPEITVGNNEGGPPTVADFDGDSVPEIGVAGADYYVVADLECLADPLPGHCSDMGIRWKRANNDSSSRVTGSSVFDFDGDGSAEVVYNDQEYCRIMDGATGTDVFTPVVNYSHTRIEMPIVADVDNDGNAEIVFIENAYGGAFQGVRIWADAADTWVPTRRIWNQHAYHVTNCDELGGIPSPEEENWLKTTDATASGVMNNFRQNLPDFSVYAAPDLLVTLEIDHSACPAALHLDAEVCNDGLLQVGAGLEVTFWDNTTSQQIPCDNDPVVTQNPLGPGACVTVTCVMTPPPQAPTVVDARACVDNPGYDCQPVTSGAGGGSSVDNGGNNECNEDNNASDASDEGCEGVPT
ncbi:MAG: VCBS repeat-containing protein, partial [Deltaproteobacteria bacterium]|nr:VCBS repeat-containing protein [Deltaproteobacteria bacterium]MBW2530118.1 VCBS repeat-containing protein [Deltaproteobacteria bacterium]